MISLNSCILITMSEYRTSTYLPRGNRVCQHYVYKMKSVYSICQQYFILDNLLCIRSLWYLYIEGCLCVKNGFWYLLTVQDIPVFPPKRLKQHTNTLFHQSKPLIKIRPHVYWKYTPPPTPPQTNTTTNKKYPNIKYLWTTVNIL